MKISFEVKSSDLMGRIGRLELNGKNLETPVFLPVVHPYKQEIPATRIREMGFDAVITNSYILYKRLASQARERGLHSLVGFDGIIMTDSGGYQMLEYGDLEIAPEEIALFQQDIGSDIAVILDRPTGKNASYEHAKETVKFTIDSARRSLNVVNRKGTAWVGPIQGGEHDRLVNYSAKEMADIGFDWFALGSPVELMNNYDFAALARMINVTRSVLPIEKPLHLFGAAHPLTMGLSVALGCDIFDSASYILFAKRGSYMTLHGSRKLDEMSYLPCSCPVCNTGLNNLLDMDHKELTENLAIHNLYVLKMELNLIKEAIKEGRLWEYIMEKGRSHPAVFEATKYISRISGIGRLLDNETPFFKERALFLFDETDLTRPEIRRHREYLARRKPIHDRVIIILPRNFDEFTFKRAEELVKLLPSIRADVFLAVPFLGLVPIELHDVYPLSQSTIRSSYQRGDLQLIRAVIGKYKDVQVVYHESRAGIAKRLAGIPALKKMDNADFYRFIQRNYTSKYK